MSSSNLAWLRRVGVANMTSQSHRVRPEKCRKDSLATGVSRWQGNAETAEPRRRHLHCLLRRRSLSCLPLRRRGNTFCECPGSQFERSQVCLRGLEIVGRWQEPEITQRQRQGDPKGKQGFNRHSCSLDKKRWLILSSLASRSSLGKRNSWVEL